MAVVGMSLSSHAVVWNNVSTDNTASMDKDGLMSKEDKEFLELLRLGYTHTSIIEVVPSPRQPLYYTKDVVQVPEWDNLISGSMSISGEVSATEIGTYTVTFTPTLAYTWADGTRTPKTVEWVILPPIIIERIPEQNGKLYEDTSIKIASWSYYEEGTCDITDDSAINAGNYTAYFTPKYGYVWLDGTRDTKAIPWVIDSSTVITDEPAQVGELTHSKNITQYPTWNVDTNFFVITGDKSGEDAYTYTAFFTPIEGYVWADGTRITKRAPWTIKKAIGSISVENDIVEIDDYNTIVYDNIITNSDGNIVVISNNPSVCKATYDESTNSIKLVYQKEGSTTISVAVTGSYNYTDANTTITVNCTDVDVLEDPQVIDTLIYNGSELSPTWNNDYTASCTITNNTATDAGSYIATFTPGDKYVWSDGTRNTKEITWSIEQATGSITVDNDVEINNIKGNITIPVRTNSPGEITVTSSDESVATASYNNGEITITYVGAGIITITVDLANTKNYTAYREIINLDAVNVATIGNPAAETIVYDGTEKYPTWTNYTVNSCIIDNDLSTIAATDAGSYTVVFTPVRGYVWADTIDREPRNINWSIEKATPSITVVTSVTLDNVNNQKVIEVSTTSDGIISVESNDESIATASYSNGEITITYVGAGTTNITVSVAESSNYKNNYKDISIVGETVIVLPDPVQDGTLTYNGSNQSPTWNLIDGTYTITGNTQTNANTYTAKITPTSGYVWSDGTTTEKDAQWTIEQATGIISFAESNIEVDDINSTNTVNITIVSDGIVSIESKDESICTASVSNGVVTITYVSEGTTTVEVTVSETVNYSEDKDNITVECVDVEALETPHQIDIPYANGSEQTCSWNIDLSSSCTITGNKATNAGTYTVTFTPGKHYIWEDTKNREPKNIQWEIKSPTVLEIPYQVGEIYFDGTEQTAVWNTDYTTSCSILNNKQINAGSYIAIFTLKQGYMWNDSNSPFGPKTVSWTIKDSIDINPNIIQSGTLTYNGNSQSPNWSNYTDGTCDISNNIGTNASDEYKATFIPKVGYVWEDTRNREEREFSWVIEKATGIIEVDKESLELTTSELEDSITITTNCEGNITVSADDNTICTVVYDNNTKVITVTYAIAGDAVITISAETTENITEAYKTVNVRCAVELSPILEENSITDIRIAALNGTAASTWSVSDSIPVTLNGQLGPNTLENFTIGLEIIGFNHNAEIEGNNTIHFQCGTKDGHRVALMWDNDPTPCHHQEGTNDGGWQGSDFRTLCYQFYNCLPVEWKNSIKPCPKYTDNVGGEVVSPNNMSVTVDEVWLLADYEEGGGPAGANPAEAELLALYTYYRRPNAYAFRDQREHYNVVTLTRDGGGYPAAWALRSPLRGEGQFMIVDRSGNRPSAPSNKPLGFAPAFAVG